MRFYTCQPVIYTSPEGERSNCQITQEFHLLGKFVKINIGPDDEFDDATGKSRKTSGFITEATKEDIIVVHNEYRERERQKAADEQEITAEKLAAAEAWYATLPEEQKVLAAAYFSFYPTNED